MREKDTLTLRIENFGMEGEGVAHADGYTFFVPYALPGESVKVAVDRVKGSVAFAHIIKMIDPSPERVDASCPLYGKCGGCSLRHISYERQIDIKRENVRALFRKNAGIEEIEIGYHECRAEGYRNKVALPFGIVDGQEVLGMYRRASHKVMPLESCPLHGEWIEPMIGAVLSFVREHRISVYDERSGKGLLRHLVARRLPVDVGYEYSVILVANGDKIPQEGALSERLAQALPGKVNVYLCKNTLHNNVILTSEIRSIRGEDHIRASLSGETWEVSPLAFLQVNFPIAEEIYHDVVAALPEGGTVVDAYSGTGIMSALIAERASRVIGIETIPDAVKDANANAARHGVGDRVKHVCGETERVLPEIASDLGEYSLVVDPPRAGLDPRVVETILSCPPERIIYVSCSPATLTRDLASLKAKYRLERVELYDMFPMTAHVETVCLLTKQEEGGAL